MPTLYDAGWTRSQLTLPVKTRSRSEGAEEMPEHLAKDAANRRPRISPGAQMRTPIFLCLTLASLSGCATGTSPIKQHPQPIPQKTILPNEQQLDIEGVTHVLRGLHRMHRGDYDGALSHFRLALIYAPKSQFIHEQLARIKALQNHDEEGDSP